MVASATGLTIFGLVNLSTLAATESGYLLLFWKQLGFVAAGFGLMALIAFLDYRVLRLRSEVVLAVWAMTLLLMIAALISGARIRGVASWLVVGPVSFGPVEFAKLALIIILAKYFASRAEELAAPRHLFWSGLYALVPAIIALMQPDFGAVILFGAVWFGIVLVLGLPLKRFLVLISIGAVALIFIWSFALLPYQQERVAAFFHPEQDPLGASWQAQQALVAVGNGGWFGRGFTETLQARLGMLPESATDFVFAALTEQFGFIGGLFLIFLIGMLLWRILRVVLQSTNNFSRACAVGIFVLLFSEAAINIAMNIGLFPVTGIPLPFVSYGGSHLLATFLMLGLVESIRLHQPQMLRPQTHELSLWE